MNMEINNKKAVMARIASATDLEADGKELEAFHSYLCCVQSVCSLLDCGLDLSTDRSQMITLAKQCLDRIQHISDRIGLDRTHAKSEWPPESAAASVAGRLRRLRGPPAPDTAWSTYRAASFCDNSTSPLDNSDPTSIEDNRLMPDPDLDLDPDQDRDLKPNPNLDPHPNWDPDPNLDVNLDPDELTSVEDNPLWPTTEGDPPPPSAPEDETVPGPTGSEDDEPVYFATDIVHQRLPVPKPVDELDPDEELSPLDVARRENERLVASYAMRMQRSPLHVQHNLSLELQRRLAENRHIAAVKHQAWLKRRQESQQHFLQLAKLVFPVPAGGQPTPDDVQKQATYADILRFEETHPWTGQLRRSLDTTPVSARAAENALLHMLLEKSHPLSKLRQRLQYSLFCKVNPLVEQHAHLLQAARVPARSPDRSPTRKESGGAGRPPERPRRNRDRQARVAKSSGGSGSRSGSDSSSDGGPRAASGGCPRPPAAEAEGRRSPSPPAQAAASPLWPELPKDDGEEAERRERVTSDDDADGREQRQQAEAFRRHLRNVISDTQDSEQLLEALAAAVHPCLSGPASRAVVQRVLFTPLWPHLLVLFRLANRRQEQRLAAVLTRLAESRAQPPPAPEHRQLLRRLLLAASPADKCRLLVELVGALCVSADGPAGADVLLPRLTALVVYSGAPQLLSELQFVSEFMSDGSFQGEQGYCLTSLQTVLLYLVQQQ